MSTPEINTSNYIEHVLNMVMLCWRSILHSHNDICIRI